MDIAVIGGGNGGYAAAADLAEKGYKVRLWRRNQDDFRPVLANQALNLKDYQGTRRVNLALASTDLASVVKDAKILIIPLPATAQTSLAAQLAPHLQDGQIILLSPGTFGSYLMTEGLLEAGCRAKVIFAETGTLPYLARKHGPDTVAITARATRLPTGVFPSRHSADAFGILQIGRAHV